MVPLNSRHTPGEFLKPASSKGISIDDIHLSSDDLEMYIDLAPFLNPSPYIVPEDMSLTKVIISFLLHIRLFCLHKYAVCF
jgi:chloride channel 7